MWIQTDLLTLPLGQICWFILFRSWPKEQKALYGENVQNFSCGTHGLSVEEAHDIHGSSWEKALRKSHSLVCSNKLQSQLKVCFKNDTHQFSLYVKISLLCNYCSRNAWNTTQECITQSTHSASQYVMMCIFLGTDAIGKPFQSIPILITNCFIKKGYKPRPQLLLTAIGLTPSSPFPWCSAAWVSPPWFQSSCFLIKWRWWS